MAKVKLDAMDRAMMRSLYPQKNDIKTMVMVRDLRVKLAFNIEETEKIELRDEGGTTKCNFAKGKALVNEFEFSEAELVLLKEQVEELDKAKQVEDNMLDLCIKIRRVGTDGTDH